MDHAVFAISLYAFGLLIVIAWGVKQKRSRVRTAERSSKLAPPAPEVSDAFHTAPGASFETRQFHPRVTLPDRMAFARPNAAVGTANMSEPPNHYVASRAAKMDEWMAAARNHLNKDGRTPDSICLCYAQGCGDRQPDVNGDFWDIVMGAYRGDQFVRVVIGMNDHPDEEPNSYDIKYSDIKKLILRRRRTPAWQHPLPDSEGYYQTYDHWYQTRIYTPSNASYAPKNAESRTRLMDARYVFDWLCKHTGADHAEDSQEHPLDGYPEGV